MAVKRSTERTEPTIFEAADSPAVMKEIGMDVLEDQQVDRETKDIFPPGGDDGPALAELSIDSVSYHFRGTTVRLFELEIEAKSCHGSKALSRFRDRPRGLDQSLGGWSFIKLETGRDPEKLIVKE